MLSLFRVCIMGAVLSALFGGSGEAQAQTRFRGTWGPNGSWGGGWNGWGDEGHWANGGLVFSPDSKLLVRCDGHNLILWQLDEKREAATLAHEGWPRLCRFAPDSRSLLVMVTGTGANTEKSEIVLWDLAARRIVWRFEQDRACVDAEFSPDGACVVTSTHPHRKGDQPMNKVVVWSTATFDEVQRLTIDKPSDRHRPQNATIDFSADGKRLLTSSHVGTTIWDTSNWQRVRTLKGSRDTLAARFSSGGRRVFAACQAKLPKDPLGVRVWDVDTGKAIAMTTFDHDQDENCSCWYTLAPDGGSLVTAAWIGERKTHRHRRHTMKLWDVSSGRETVVQHSVADQPYWHSGAAVFSADGEHFAFAPWQANPEIRLINAKSWLLDQTFDMAVEEDAKSPAVAWDRWVRGVRFSPDGRWLAAARSLERSRDHEIFLWELPRELRPRPNDSAGTK